MRRAFAIVLAVGLAASCGGKSAGVEGGGGASGRDGSGGETSSGGSAARGANGGAAPGSGGAPRTGSGGAEAACRYNSDCAPPLVCATDLQCRNQCVSARDCGPNQLCQFGVCVSPTPGAGGMPTIDAGRCAVASSPIYDCEWDPAATDGCPPAEDNGGGSGGSAGAYPLGCTVQLPRLDGFSGCGPQSCTCERVPQADGSFKSSWTCPL